ncbi:hypothetical protein [Hyphomicrobium sp. LHD-15]|uniref:hypothetical protein n=1 Tax=Hyphomicrobium sp. LHD-15 TaxID=3072142 RepID=UPI0028107E5F|nr:hypothetical protein [Hyphomicrobium sp. LHD-15]MDQ8698485.1 hypothetical protein [Hyphomicrobium sp. LHD-15]
MLGDIVNTADVTPLPYVVVGFFTPNYRPLADRLSAELTKTQNPHHLIAREKGSSTWRDIVHMKPGVVLEAMDRYPTSSIILLDADSSVRGSLAPMLDFVGDISARSKLRLTNHVWPFRQKTVLHISSRSMVFKPNARVRKFLEDWQTELRTASYHQGGCEMAMRFVIMRSTGLAFCPMNPDYSGMEVDQASDSAIVVHSSESRVAGRK